MSHFLPQLPFYMSQIYFRSLVIMTASVSVGLSAHVGSAHVVRAVMFTSAQSWSTACIIRHTSREKRQDVYSVMVSVQEQFSGLKSQQTQDIEMMLVSLWSSVVDVGPKSCVCWVSFS